eukprot:TRINITY_DN3237_c0_g1_i1.p3 TRINITY_DN3237_c0_g1~~TRINITY_DN3237_c0_g1_i1.p3  ORF type:complete len:114 (+),score=29.36 TRINITY_DN3237_c0_g1_i1:638-979(+)
MACRQEIDKIEQSKDQKPENIPLSQDTPKKPKVLVDCEFEGDTRSFVLEDDADFRTICLSVRRAWEGKLPNRLLMLWNTSNGKQLSICNDAEWKDAVQGSSAQFVKMVLESPS